MITIINFKFLNLLKYSVMFLKSCVGKDLNGRSGCSIIIPTSKKKKKKNLI